MFYLTINKNPALYKFVQGSRGILSNYPGLYIFDKYLLTMSLLPISILDGKSFSTRAFLRSNCFISFSISSGEISMNSNLLLLITFSLIFTILRCFCISLGYYQYDPFLDQHH